MFFSTKYSCRSTETKENAYYSTSLFWMLFVINERKKIGKKKTEKRQRERMNKPLQTGKETCFRIFAVFFFLQRICLRQQLVCQLLIFLCYFFLWIPSSSRLMTMQVIRGKNHANHSNIYTWAASKCFSLQNLWETRRHLPQFDFVSIHKLICVYLSLYFPHHFLVTEKNHIFWERKRVITQEAFCLVGVNENSLKSGVNTCLVVDRITTIIRNTLW